MPSPEMPVGMLSQPNRKRLLALARQSIEHGLSRGRALSVRPEDYPMSLREQRSCFVTLNRGGTLRGCIGHLEAVQPLVLDVVENAYSAAFRDPRFSPLGQDELMGLNVHVSVLSPPTRVEFSSQQSLIAKLRPGVDGLILQEGRHRGTFLPSVWESLPEPVDFLRHLKTKAGLAADYWSEGIEIFRYETDSFQE